MMQVQMIDRSLLIAFWLCFSRWLAIMFQLPLFDNGFVAGSQKALLCFLIAYAFFPFTKSYVLQDIAYIGEGSFWILTIYYMLVGLIIGFLVKSIMFVFISSGSIISQQVGFGAVSYFDPSAAQRIGPFEKLIHWSIVIMVISSGALIPMFKGVVVSFEKLQMINLVNINANPSFFMDSFKGIFSSAILLATPIIFTNMILYMILGIIARTIPQMNVLMVSFILNIGLGLTVFLVTSNEFFTVGYRIYVEKLGDWFKFIN